MCARAREDLALTGKIEAIHRGSKGVYGSPMIHAELADDHQIRVSRKRVARLMRCAGLRGATLRKFVVTNSAGTIMALPYSCSRRLSSSLTNPLAHNCPGAGPCRYFEPFTQERRQQAGVSEGWRHGDALRGMTGIAFEPRCARISRRDHRLPDQESGDLTLTPPR
jgi:hypothetical protein